jgi:single-strand DNA-binding protein
MFSLNSVLIEGAVVNGPVETADNRCEFDILSARDEADAINGGTVHKEFRVEVEARAFRLARSCLETLKTGRGVRVVGRLESETYTALDGMEHTEVVIVAEHVEFMPIQKRPQPVNKRANDGAEWMGDHDSGL